MTMERAENWANGSNNRSDPSKFGKDKAGATFLREAINVDVLDSGSLASRIGYELAFPSISNARCIYALGDTLFYLDDDVLIRRSLADGSVAYLANVGLTETMAGVVHNEELFLSLSGGQRFRCKGNIARPWGVATVTAVQRATAETLGTLLPGTYKFACTLVNQYGEEGGARKAGTITLAEGSNGFTIDNFPFMPADHYLRLYISDVNGTTLYLQKEITTAPVDPLHIRSIYTGSLTLDTQFYREPPIGDILASYNGLILIAKDNTVWITRPMRVHLASRMIGFFQFPADVSNVITVDAGIYITADATYFLTSPETSEPSMRQVFEIGAIKNTAVQVTENRVAWMTQYGQAIGSNDGEVTLVHKDIYSPLLSDSAAATTVRHNGMEIIVTAPIRPQATTRLTKNFADARVALASQAARRPDGVGLASTFEAEVVV